MRAVLLILFLTFDIFLRSFEQRSRLIIFYKIYLPSAGVHLLSINKTIRLDIESNRTNERSLDQSPLARIFQSIEQSLPQPRRKYMCVRACVL